MLLARRDGKGYESCNNCTDFRFKLHNAYAPPLETSQFVAQSKRREGIWRKLAAKSESDFTIRVYMRIYTSQR